MSYEYINEHPASRRNPEDQIRFITKLLQRQSESLYKMFGIEAAELQVFIYYEKKIPGEVDVLMSEQLLSELCKHHIRISITVLP